MFFSLLAASLLTSCSKTEVKKCDRVTINVTNLLDKNITNLSIDGVVVGNVASGGTNENICLDLVHHIGSSPLLYLSGRYDGENIDLQIIQCGTGLKTDESGTYDIEITNVLNGVFYYTTL